MTRARRSVLVVAAVVVVVAAGVVATGIALWDDDEPDGVTNAGVEAYAAAITGPGREGGRLVVEEVRPSLTDYRSGRLGRDEFVRRAGRWEADFRRLRDEFGAAPAPGPLGEVADLYDDALRRYVAAMAAFRRGDVDEGTAAAEAADDAYDRAGAALEELRRKAGRRPPRPGRPPLGVL